jgi:uncharacterized protein (TIGR03545 family)
MANETNNREIENNESKSAQTDKTKKIKKTGFIRKKAVIPVLVIVLAITLGGYFFLDNIIKTAVIKSGELIFKAKVDINKVDVSFKPFGVTFHGLKVANRKAPMQNLFELKKVNANLMFTKLLQKKIIINNVEIKDISIATPRKKSGALPKKKLKKAKEQKEEKEAKTESNNNTKTTKGKEPEKKSKKLPNINFDELANKVDISKLVDVNNLPSTKKAKALEANLNAKKTKWENTLKNNNYNEQLKEIEESFKSLGNLKVETPEDLANAQKSISEISNIQKKIDAIKNDINKQQKAFKKDFSSTNKDIRALTKAGNQDYKEIMKKVSLDNINAGNIGEMLFGKAINDKLSFVLEQYKSIKEKIPTVKDKKAPQKTIRQKGTDVHFPSKTKPVPWLWIKKVVISGKGISEESISGKITNISSNQDITGLATKLNLKGDSLLQKGTTLKASAVIDHRKGKQKDSIQGSLTNLRPKPYTLYNQDSKQIELTSSVMNSVGDIKITDNKLDGIINVKGKKLKFTTTNIDRKQLTIDSILAQVLDKTKDIKIKGTITGKLTSPGFGISSDIDKKFTKAVNEITQAKIKEIQDNIKKEIDANIKKVQNDLMASSGLSQNDVGSLLKGDIQNVDAVNNAVEKEKGKLEKEQKKVQQKIQKELDAQKAKLEAEKKKVEAAARKEAEKQKKKLESEAKKQLQNLFKF